MGCQERNSFTRENRHCHHVVAVYCASAPLDYCMIANSLTSATEYRYSRPGSFVTVWQKGFSDGPLFQRLQGGRSTILFQKKKNIRCLTDNDDPRSHPQPALPPNQKTNPWSVFDTAVRWYYKWYYKDGILQAKRAYYLWYYVVFWPSEFEFL